MPALAGSGTLPHHEITCLVYDVAWTGFGVRQAFLMENGLIQQIALMLLETILVSSILLVFFRFRKTFGFAPIYTMLGVFFQLANLWSATIYIRITPEIMLSPGSVVLFPASIFSVLFIYIREDAAEARKLIYALLATDFVGSILSLMAVQHLRDPNVFNPFNLSPALFVHMPRLDLVGSITLYADALLIILVYEFFARRLKGMLFLPIYLSITLVLLFDTVVFATGSFVEQPNYVSILLSGLLGKSIAGLLYSTVLWIYLSRFDQTTHTVSDEPRRLGDIFDVLTYRQKYEALRIQATRDRLTNVYNRAFFDEVLASELAMSHRSERPLSLLMIDIDFFKQINDTYGHAEGDRALAKVAGALQSIIRQSEFLCRYGGEEFAVILPGSDLDQAIILAERLCAEVPSVCCIASQAGVSGDQREEKRITTTIGIATYPTEAKSAEALIKLADSRLYQGKQAGRNRVVPSAVPEPELVHKE